MDPLISEFYEKYEFTDKVHLIEERTKFCYVCQHCEKTHIRCCKTLLESNVSSSRSLCTEKYFNDKKSAVGKTRSKRTVSISIDKAANSIYLDEFYERFDTKHVTNLHVFVSADIVYYRYKCLRCNEIHLRKHDSIITTKISPHNRSLCTNKYHYDLKKTQIEKFSLRLDFSDSETDIS